MFRSNRSHFLTCLLSSLLATKIPAVVSHSTILTNPAPTSPTSHHNRTTKCNHTDARKETSQSRKAHAHAQGAINPAAAATPTPDLVPALALAAVHAPVSAAKSKTTSTPLRLELVSALQAL
jgi:hypothetical protein